MADEIKLKAPTVEQQVVVNISGEDKLEKFADTLDKISKGRGLQKYWKDQQTLINDTIKAFDNFNKSASQADATELIKTTNALKAMSNVDISTIIPDFNKFTSVLSKAEGMAGHLTDAFTEKAFKDTFSSFETLKAYGVDLDNFFKHFELDINVANLQESLKLAERETRRVKRELSETQEELSAKKIELASFIEGSGLTEQVNKLKYLEDEIRYVREQASEEFRAFLKGNDFTGWDLDENGVFEKYFNEIKEGSLTAKEAIANFKQEYSYLLQDKFAESGGLFNLQQVQEFENKLESVLVRVEEISRQMNDIVENGVMTKAMQNLSVDSSISQSQRDLFANILKDEESLSSIASILKKIIDESVSLQNTNNKIFDEEQFNRLLILFEKIESSLSSMKAVFVNVGDGEEFSPLLKMIDNVQSSIKGLSASVKEIGFNMNIDFGSDTEMESKVQSKIANALQAYQRLFEHIKMSSAGGSLINTSFFEFDINQYDTMMGKLQAYRKFIENMRKEAKKQFDGKDVLFQDTDKSYWNSASAAMGQVTKAFNEMKTSVDSNPMENLFGGKTDLTEVITQLNLIVDKLGEISTTASEFKNVFKEGFNVTTSVEEIEKLTNRIKELEDELSKVKLNPAVSNKSNNSSPIKDVFQDEAKASADSSAPAIKEESKAMEQVAESAEKASKGKDKFAESNKRVKQSVDDSVSAVKEEKISLSSMQTEIDNFNKKSTSFKVKPDDEHSFASWKNQINELDSKIAEYQSRLDTIKAKGGIVDKDDEAEIKKIREELQGLVLTMSKTSSSERGWTDISATKTAEKIHDLLVQNSKITKKAKDQISAYYDELASGNPSRPVNEILVEVNKLVQAERAAGREGKNFLDVLSSKVFLNRAAQLASYYLSFTDIIRYGQQAINVVRELDTALVDLKKTTTMSTNDLAQFYFDANDAAKELGTTTKEIIQQASNWSRLGFSDKDSATEMAKLSSQFASISPGMDLDMSTDGLVSSMKAFDIEVEDVERKIMDNINRIGNTAATSNEEIVDMLTRSSAAMAVANNTIEETIALETAAVEITRNAETTGTAFKTISMRIRGRQTLPPYTVMCMLCA